MIRKTKPLEKLPKRFFSLPRISVPTPEEIKRKRLEASKKASIQASIEAFTIETLIETRVKKLKNNAFLYLIHAVPHTSEYFTPYNLV